MRIKRDGQTIGLLLILCTGLFLCLAEAMAQTGAVRQRPLSGRERMRRENLRWSKTLRLIPDGSPMEQQRRSFEDRQQKSRIRQESREASRAMREIKRQSRLSRQQMRLQMRTAREIMRLTRRLARLSLETTRHKRLRLLKEAHADHVKNRRLFWDSRNQSKKNTKDKKAKQTKHETQKAQTASLQAVQSSDKPTTATIESHPAGGYGGDMDKNDQPVE